MGRSYTLATDEPEEHVRQVARYVDEKLKEFSEGRKFLSLQDVAILASLNIAGELFQARREGERLSREVEERTVRILNRIEKRG